MLTAVPEEATRGLKVKWQRPIGGTANSGVVEGFQWFVPTAQLAETLQRVLYISRPWPYSEAASHLEKLTALQRGWDGHGAEPVAPGAVARALEFLRGLDISYRGAVPPPAVGPLPDGAVTLVWRDKDQEVEITFANSGETIEYAVSDREARRPTEFQERVSMDFFLSVIVPQYLAR